MNAKSTSWKIIALVATLSTAAIPGYIAFDLYHRGPSPQKHVELTRVGPIDVLRDLSNLRSSTISITVGDETFNNLVISHTFLKNIGDAPIVPDDYHRNLSVSVTAPWRIVAVENQSDFSGAVLLEWRRISDTKFEAEPALFNPGDMIIASIYLTNTEFSTFKRGEESNPELKWDTRITNLSHFYETPSFPTNIGTKTSLPIIVHLVGWAVPFTIVVALSFQALYLHLLRRVGFLRSWGWKSIGFVLGTGLLSFSAAECVSTYVFPSIATVFGVNHLINAPPIMIHAGVIGLLLWKVRSRSRETPLEAG
jgi:hypothetical protein